MIQRVHIKLGYRKPYAFMALAGTHITLTAAGEIVYATISGRGHRRRVDGFVAQVCREHRSAADALRVLDAVARSHRVRFTMNLDRFRAAIAARAEA